jgi:hypothetical protein
MSNNSKCLEFLNRALATRQAEPVFPPVGWGDRQQANRSRASGIAQIRDSISKTESLEAERIRRIRGNP